MTRAEFAKEALLILLGAALAIVIASVGASLTQLAALLIVALLIWWWWRRPTLFLIIPVIVGAIAIFAATITLKRDYVVKYQLCRQSGPDVVDGKPVVKYYQIGLRLINAGNSDVFVKVDQGTLALAGGVAGPPGKGDELTLPVQSDTAYVVRDVDFRPPISPTTSPAGDFSFALRYGKDSSSADKHITFRGKITVQFDETGGQSLINLQPTVDTAEGFVDTPCLLPQPG